MPVLCIIRSTKKVLAAGAYNTVMIRYFLLKLNVTIFANLQLNFNTILQKLFFSSHFFLSVSSLLGVSA